jgi:hypothetical protein
MTGLIVENEVGVGVGDCSVSRRDVIFQTIDFVTNCSTDSFQSDFSILATAAQVSSGYAQNWQFRFFYR